MRARAASPRAAGTPATTVSTTAIAGTRLSYAEGASTSQDSTASAVPAIGDSQRYGDAEYLDLTTVPDRVALLAGLISHLG
jgi:hypothetical protein